MTAVFHVSSIRNRDSIRIHGLDWQFMGPALGIAGSSTPEAEGIFLCRDEWEMRYFVRLNNTGGPVDVWAVDGIDTNRLLDNGNGYGFLPATVSARQLALFESDLDPVAEPWPGEPG
jgi:hypothetical protein